MKIISRQHLQYGAIVALVSFSLTSCQIFPTVPVQPSQESSRAQLSQTVDIKDGDTYELTAAPIKKIIE